MGYWTDRDQDGPPKSTEGWHRYKVTKVMRGTEHKDFQSKSGDPQILVIFQDEDSAEASAMFTLSDKASWVLARFLARAGVDLERLDEEAALADFAHEATAQRWLEGLKVWANCEHQRGNDGKVYTRLSFFHEHEVPGNVLSRGKSGSPATAAGPDTFGDGSPVPDDDDIPF